MHPNLHHKPSHAVFQFNHSQQDHPRLLLPRCSPAAIRLGIVGGVSGCCGLATPIATAPDILLHCWCMFLYAQDWDQLPTPFHPRFLDTFNIIVLWPYALLFAACGPFGAALLQSAVVYRCRESPAAPGNGAGHIGQHVERTLSRGLTSGEERQQQQQRAVA